MKVRTSTIVTCCFWDKTFEDEYVGLDYLLSHIKVSHKELSLRLAQRARILARSQNGLGYWDSETDDGWSRAQPAFRTAWTIKALREHLSNMKVSASLTTSSSSEGDRRR